MLIRFTVENFLSFNQRLDFNMIASPEERHKHHITKGPAENDIGLLRTSIIYGPNAAGKSNILKAMAFAKQFIVEGVKRDKNIQVQPFKLDPQCLQKTTRFEFEFRSQDRNYAYGFVVDDTKVHEEWLFEIGLKLESPIYERDPQGTRFNFDHELFLNLPEEDKQRLAFEVKGTRENLLFLTNCQERNIKLFQAVFEWFEDVLQVVFPNAKIVAFPFAFKENQEFHSFFNTILEAFDFGININIAPASLEQVNIPKEAQELIKFRKNVAVTFSLDGNEYVMEKTEGGTSELLEMITTPKKCNGARVFFEMAEESRGTQRMINLIPLLKTLLSKPGRVLIIDEIENSLHVLLIKKLFELVLSNHHFVNTESQLIATTHKVHLLDLKNLFRKDEIWLVEKDHMGQSIAYSLANAEIDHLDLMNGYLNGRFGALPFVRNIRELVVMHKIEVNRSSPPVIVAGGEERKPVFPPSSQRPEEPRAEVKSDCITTQSTTTRELELEH
jgi:hypothetical protein